VRKVKETVKRKGIFGGTFNPIHMGHLLCCEEVREKFNLDNIVFIPSAAQPHKESSDIIDPYLRYEMVKLGIEDNPFFEASDIELKSSGKSFTINTIKKFRSIYGEGVLLFFILGIDAFLEFETWKDPQELVTLCHFVVMLRPGHSPEATLNLLPAYIKKRILLNVEKIELINYNDNEKNIVYVPVTAISLSSTGIRERIKKGRSIKYYVPKEVELFIRRNKLYKGVG